MTAESGEDLTLSQQSPQHQRVRPAPPHTALPAPRKKHQEQKSQLNLSSKYTECTFTAVQMTERLGSAIFLDW